MERLFTRTWSLYASGSAGVFVALPDGHRADLVADALAAKITTLPAALTRTLTWDQSHEMAAHARFTGNGRSARVRMPAALPASVTIAGASEPITCVSRSMRRLRATAERLLASALPK